MRLKRPSGVDFSQHLYMEWLHDYRDWPRVEDEVLTARDILHRTPVDSHIVGGNFRNLDTGGLIVEFVPASGVTKPVHFDSVGPAVLRCH